MQPKSIWRSKTFWMNVITAVALILAAPEVLALFGEHTLQFVVAGQAVLNIIMRVLSSAPVSMTGTGSGQ